MTPKARSDSNQIIPPSLEEIMAKIREHIPEEDEGAFCRSDLAKALGVSPQQASNLLDRWRDKCVVIPAGKVTRLNAWGDKRRNPAYRLREEDEISE